MLRCFRNRSEDIHSNVIKGSGCWEKLKFALTAVCRIIRCAPLAFVDYTLYLFSHVRLVKFAFWRIVLSTLAEMSHSVVK